MIVLVEVSKCACGQAKAMCVKSAGSPGIGLSKSLLIRIVDSFQFDQACLILTYMCHCVHVAPDDCRLQTLSPYYTTAMAAGCAR